MALINISNEQYCTFEPSSLTITITYPHPLPYHSPNEKQAKIITKMTSKYALFGRLSAKTIAADDSGGLISRDLDERLNFYLTYLEDVVPDGVTIRHVPNNRQHFELRLSDSSPRNRTPVRREEIQLRYEGGVFMTCVLSLDYNPTLAEEVAGNLAYMHWSDGYFVRDNHQAWRMFTALKKIRFFSSRHGREWDQIATYSPIMDAGNVALYLQREFDRVRFQ